ncbi:MAG: AAA family ATPase [Clostridia bacterium]|nr:AAA family ATPase [Clostridia bacterium]
MTTQFIGREKEIKVLDRSYHSARSELVAVYGRRRVGKTFLVRTALGSVVDFEFTGMYQTSGKEQRKQFLRTLERLTGRKRPIPTSWFELFDQLREYLLSLNKDSVVVFLDELPWMDTPKSSFLSAFSRFWNEWAKESVKLKLYVCGSATTWMIDKLIGDKGGLYGRISRSIYLAPFSLLECEEYLNKVKEMDYDRFQILSVYMIMGGIPYYLDMLDSELPLSVNIDRMFFAENAPLKTEFDFLFRSLFKEGVNYRRVVEVLAGKLAGMTREEIVNASHLTGGELSLILKNLNSCDFIRSYTEPGKKERGRVYQLTDMFSLFYLRFVQGHNGQDRKYWTNLGQSGLKSAWSGYAFEQVCLHHIDQIKVSLGISGILSNVYAWSCRPFTDESGNVWNGGQIDLIIDRSDGVMNLCEMKYTGDEFVIEKDYADTIRKRMALFRRVKGTKKNLRCTFLTVYGVKTNKYSGIADHQLVLDDLFK